MASVAQSLSHVEASSDRAVGSMGLQMLSFWAAVDGHNELLNVVGATMAAARGWQHEFRNVERGPRGQVQ